MYTEFYVRGDGGHDGNAGGPRMAANGGPVMTTTSARVDASDATVIENVGGDWAGVQVDDWLLYDPADPRLRRVTELAPGGNTSLVRVHAALPTGQGKTVRVGGAWRTISGALALLRHDMTDAAGNPVRLNVQRRNYPESPSTVAGGTPSLPITIEGYEVTAGDGGVPEISGTLALNHSHIIVRNVRVSRATGNHAVGVGAQHVSLINITAMAGDIGYAAFDISSNYVRLIECSAWNSFGGFVIGGLGALLLGCYANACDEFGFRNTTLATFHSCIATNCGIGFDCPAAALVMNCVANGCDSHGFAFSGAAHSVLASSLATGCGGYGVMRTAAAPLYCDCNATWSNTSGHYDGVPQAMRGRGSMVLVNSPYVINSLDPSPASPHGRALLGAALPRNVGDMRMRYDIGAVQAAIAGNRRG